MNGHTQRKKVILAIIHTGLWCPLWWVFQNYYGPYPIANSVIKFIIYSNTFLMLGAWFEARGREYTEKDLLKFYLWVLIFFILMETPWILYNL